LFVGSLIDIFRETIGASDDEDEATSSITFLFQPAGKLNTAIFLSVFIQKDNSVRRLQFLQNQFALGLFLLFFRKVLGVLQFLYGDYFKRHIMINMLDIIVDDGDEMLVDRLTNL
jgi:hypothetical protein